MLSLEKMLHFILVLKLWRSTFKQCVTPILTTDIEMICYAAMATISTKKDEQTKL